MVLVAMAVTSAPAAADSKKNSGGKKQDRQDRVGKFDRALHDRAGKLGWSRAIITLKPGVAQSDEVQKLGGRHLRRLGLINGQVVELPNFVLKKLAERSEILRIDLDRPTAGHLSHVANVTGARAAQFVYGYTGAGVGVAVIDSGVTNWHDDLNYSGSSSNVRVVGNQRIAKFVDFVNGGTQPYDDNGHGTHVTGIIAGNGYDSRGTKSGIAPAAHIVSLKVLDAQGRGVISDVIAAIEWAIANRAAYNIRVINLSVGAAVTTSYNTDPLTLAAKRAVDAGIVVVTASGNLGRSATGKSQYGAITAPGNAPWVLTVGASDHKGTLNRKDDVVALYSSKGPTAIDYAAKPDIVAPGTGIISLTSVNSTLYKLKASSLVSGVFNLLGPKPYLSLSGTSMAAPVVSGTVALMLEANPALTPNLVKAILQYTAQLQPGVDYMTQGGGFLNSYGAVELSRYFATAKAGQRYPADKTWSKSIIWGNRRIGHGAISPKGTAWNVSTLWGAAYDSDGDNVVWGTECETASCKNVVWGTAVLSGDNVVWGTASAGDNVVWGTASDDSDNVVWGTFEDGDNVVWGTVAIDGDNVVWGTACAGDDCFNVVWGTFDYEGDNVVWGTFDSGDNVVWGTSGETPSSIWATTDEVDSVVWDQSVEEIMVVDPVSFLLLLEPESTPVEQPLQLLPPVNVPGSGIL
jgi:serine protease AprX